ncbi:amidohydrolase/deacetylase family metallohydrolase [Erwinia tasmaniensis]|uniref:Amidohydrolase n=1 Tax=Erwinia tasmaniensis (strain DSM 17950 / CFBP 7177 / CIP 109463 / NCPPB 4357 / Et1/99) TaxID=465817 RepID=B2VCZ6_ERWT9|nr:amidohydrolase/deacetylase family metallohydrolase [Erwinia tasmaniensis]CAO97973.1 Putative amidohydrolase [Erwinia tasmaniensis Et1/99]
MFDLIIRQARLSNGALTDIAIDKGKIAAVGMLSGSAVREWDLAGRYWLSAGWIDSHVHCYAKSPIYHDEADRIGVESGVTTVVDAGSAGADEIDDFFQLTRGASTRVYALLNIARGGIVTQNELADMANLDEQAVKAALQRHPGFIVGLKARISSSVVEQNGIQPLRRAKTMQQDNGQLPLMVHIGNDPPDLDEIADLLTAGDTITHCYHGKANRILAPSGILRASITRALQRGVRLDVGHGSASFSFAVARAAIAQGILPHTISSDIYCRNRLNGPVYSLAQVMSKFLHLGMTLSQVIDCVTTQAADGLRLAEVGRLEPGYAADLTIFDLQRAVCLFGDSDGQTLPGERQLVPLVAVVGGQGSMTDEGKKRNDLSL